MKLTAKASENRPKLPQKGNASEATIGIFSGKQQTASFQGG